MWCVRSLVTLSEGAWLLGRGRWTGVGLRSHERWLGNLHKAYAETGNILVKTAHLAAREIYDLRANNREKVGGPSTAVLNSRLFTVSAGYEQVVIRYISTVTLFRRNRAPFLVNLMSRR